MSDWGIFAALVHVAAERTESPVGELIHAVTKQSFVFGQSSSGGLRHAEDVTKPPTPKLRRAGGKEPKIAV